MLICTSLWKVQKLFALKVGSQYDEEPCVALHHDALRNCEHFAMSKRVGTQRSAKERKNRPGFYSSVVTRGLDAMRVATHRNAGPCIYCEPAFRVSVMKYMYICTCWYWCTCWCWCTVSMHVYSYFCLQLSKMEISLRTLEGERDFYFSKLRDIEIICQDNQDNPVVAPILEIMYATEVMTEHTCTCTLSLLLSIVLRICTYVHVQVRICIHVRIL